MGYTFTIGRAVVRTEPAVDEGWPPQDRLYLDVEPCDPQRDGSPPHRDVYEMQAYEGSPVRLPSYSTWTMVCEACPAFEALWERLERNMDGIADSAIPVSAYVDDLDAVERSAEQLLAEGTPPSNPPERGEVVDLMREFDSDKNHAAAERVLWFVRWSRLAFEHYGDHAAFERPGEW